MEPGMSQERPAAHSAVVSTEVRRIAAKSAKRKKLAVPVMGKKARSSRRIVLPKANGVHDRSYDAAAGLSLAQTDAHRALTTGALKEHRQLYERLLAQLMMSVGIKPTT